MERIHSKKTALKAALALAIPSAIAGCGNQGDNLGNNSGFSSFSSDVASASAPTEAAFATNVAQATVIAAATPAPVSADRLAIGVGPFTCTTLPVDGPGAIDEDRNGGWSPAEEAAARAGGVKHWPEGHKIVSWGNDGTVANVLDADDPGAGENMKNGCHVNPVGYDDRLTYVYWQNPTATPGSNPTATPTGTVRPTDAATATSVATNAATATPRNTDVVPTAFPTGEPTRRTETCDVSEFRHWAQDILTSIPSLGVDENELTMRLMKIGDLIPSDVPFQARPCYGLVPNPATGEVVQHVSPAFRNAPEGGFHYGSFGHANYSENGRLHELSWRNGNVHLAFVVGRPDDNTPADLNTTVTITDYPAGHMFVNQAHPEQNQAPDPDRRVVNEAWFAQQLWWAAQSGSNCGVGCEQRITVSFFDAANGQEYFYKVDPKTFEWKQMTKDQLRSLAGQAEADRMAHLTGRNRSRMTGSRRSSAGASYKSLFRS